MQLIDPNTSAPSVLGGVRSRGVRVVHVTQPTTAGVAHWLVDATNTQVGLGWDVTVVAPGSLPGLSGDVRLEEWPAVREPGPGLAREVQVLRRLIQRADPDVVHLHAAKAGLAGRLVVRGSRPTIYQPHGWSFLAASPRIAPAVTAWERLASRWTDAIVCVSDAEAHTARSQRIRGRFEVIANGIDVERWQPSPPEQRAHVRHELNLGTGPVAVCVGRLSHQKGQDILLDAWAHVRRQLPHARLVLVGDGPDRERLQTHAGPDITFLGWRDDIARLVSAADLVVAASRWEGLSLAVLEALACARPVIATDVQGMREAILDGPEPPAGLIVPPENPPALAAALTELLASPQRSEQLGRAARARVLARNDQRATLARVVTLTQDLTHPEPGPR